MLRACVLLALSFLNLVGASEVIDVEKASFSLLQVETHLTPVSDTEIPGTPRFQFPHQTNRTSNRAKDAVLRRWVLLRWYAYNFTHLHHRLRQSPLSPVAGILSATLAGITVGLDDVIWLLPFLTTSEKWQNLLFYVCFKLASVLGSWAATSGMERIKEENPRTPIRHDSQLVSCAILTLITLYLFREWLYSNRDNGKDQAGTLQQDNVRTGQSSSIHHHTQLGLWMLFLLSAAGSVDCFSVFPGMLMSGRWNVLELSVGVLLGSSLLGTALMLLAQIRVIVQFIECFPLWILFAGISIWSYFALTQIHG
jgi:hypothetical protein